MRMDCKEAQVLLIPHILGDLDPDSRQCHELEAHLLSCQVCAEEYETNKWVVEFIQEHKTLFAEAFETIDKKRAAEQEEIKRSWQAVQAKLAKIEAQEKQAKLRRTLWKVTAAAAACVVIGISAWLTLSNSKTLEKPIMQQLTVAPAPSMKIELLSDTGNIAVPAGTQIKTTASELKTLIVNGRHRMVLNTETALSIEPLEDNGRLGCMIKLAAGEIFTHVEHDGNPFIVGTAHGKAIIKGTTFDVKAADAGTTLVVTEGTVQFESEQGLVEVAAGQISEIVAQSAPTKPVSCDTTELTAWATGHEIKTVLAKIRSTLDAYDLTDLWLSARSGPIDLEAINYENWIEKKRDWFKREFPWIFQLQDALKKERIEVDYPELLIQSGDVWQFVCLDVSPARFSVVDPNSLLKIASNYGFDKRWLLENVPAAKSALEKPVLSANSFTGLKVFERWLKYLDETNELEPPTPIYSFHASKYLANTRSLIWFAVKDGKYGLTDEERAEVLVLLQEEVTAACNCQNDELYPLDEQEKPSCDDDTFKTADERIIEYIETIKDVEERIRILNFRRNNEEWLN